MTLATALRKAYRWKPGRTFAQALAAGLATTGAVGILDAAWIPVLSAAALAGVISFLQAWADGTDQFAADKDAN
jgi:hypothetical protein